MNLNYGLHKTETSNPAKQETENYRIIHTTPHSMDEKWDINSHKYIFYKVKCIKTGLIQGKD